MKKLSPSGNGLLSSVMFVVGFLAVLVASDRILGSMGPAKHVRGANSIIAEKTAEVNSTNPEIVFFGTSVCQEGVDEKLVGNMLGMRASKHCGHIQRSAYYYLFFKNILLNESIKTPPSIVAILFVYGTLTEIRDSLNYDEELYINSISTPEDDELLDSLIYQTDEKSLAGFLRRHSFFLRKLQIYRRYIAEKIREHGPLVFSALRDDANALFHRKKFRPDLYEVQVAQMLQQGSDHHLATLDTHISETFLPEIILLAEQYGIKLIFIHMPLNSHARVRVKKVNNNAYLKDLREYSRNRNIQVIDYSDSPEFGAEDFPPGDRVHLNDLGRARFAELLSRDLIR